jgi:hypothetical protein
VNSRKEMELYKKILPCIGKRDELLKKKNLLRTARIKKVAENMAFSCPCGATRDKCS